MIEKFSEEELKQIKKELGITESFIKPNVLRNEIASLNIAWNKPFAKYSHVFNVIDITLSNVEKRKNDTYAIKREINETDIDEYKQMFQEILEIIKKHNRKWERDNH